MRQKNLTINQKVRKEKKRATIRVFVLIALMISLVQVTGVERTNVQEEKLTQEGLKVVTSISIPADFAEQIMGELGTVESIVSGLEDPHTYEASASDILTVREADLFIELGLEGLEGWISPILAANPGVEVITIVNSSMMEYDEIIDAVNPHVWMGVGNVKSMVKQIYQKIISIDPDNEVSYMTNYETYIDELTDLQVRIAGNRTIFENTKVVVHHPSFKYLLDDLGIIRVGAIEQSEGGEPSPQHIQNIIDLMKEEDVKLLINQPQLDESDVVQIARDTGAKIADLTPLLGVETEEGVIDNYIEMIDWNMIQLANPKEPAEENNLTTYIIIVVGTAGVVAVFGTMIYLRRR
jgi:ABC-type Zn uptake system ZnuABC Zn-binding protein ZnuA